MSVAYLMLGTNENDRFDNIKKARKLISVHIGYINKSSSLYETESWGFKAEQNFYNQVVVVETALNPYDLIKNTIVIEEKLGRIRTSEQYTSRIIDIDILFYDSIIIKSLDLEIPHPRISERKFVLEPMKEIEAGLLHPVFYKTISQLYNECIDKLKVWRLPDIQE